MKLYVLLFMSVKIVFSFNIDIDNTISFRGDDGTHFGYSAVLVNNTEGNWVVVAAPKAMFSGSPEITQPGNVYKCKVNFTSFQQENCVPIPLRPTDKMPSRWNELPGYEEDNQLLGASMAHLGNKIVICAPLWKNMIPLKEKNAVYTYGRCHNLDITFKTNNTKKFNFTIPQSKNFETYEFTQAGFSVSPREMHSWDTHSVLLGAPGLYDGRGGFLRYIYDESDNFFDIYTHLNITTDVKNSISKGTLMGYSIATGNISLFHRCPNVVLLGAPHFNTEEGVLGAVLLFCLYADNTMELKKQVFGNKHGSGFGSAIVFDDINNDGLDDLMVGAPLQYDKVIDSGAVHVFLGKSEDILINKQVLEDAKVESARFGTALECVGDLNKDGYKDLVVGAPYQDNLSGAIYIYHGSGEPKPLKFAQTIRAADVNIRPVSFGWFISSPLDIDQNNYPVGSYMSDTVSILRSRPIIKLSCSVTIDPPNIPLNSSGQVCQDDNFRPCADVKVCFTFSGVGIPEKILVSYTINADTLRTNAIPSKPSRVFMYVNSTNHKSTHTEENIKVRKEGKTCRSLTAIVPIVTRQFLSALKEAFRVEASFGLSEQQHPGQLKPILDNKPKIETASAMFLSECNEICHPNLKLEVSFEPNQIIFGRTNELVVQIRVTNHDEPSHGTRITIIATNNTNFLGFYQPQGQLTELGSCGVEFDHNNASDLNCDLSRTLYQQQQGLFNVRFNVSQEILTSDISDKFNVNRAVGFTVNASTTGVERDNSDNVIQVNISVKFVSELQLQGTPEPEQKRLSDLQNVLFTHKYDLYNTGPSPLKNGVVRICQPIIGDIEMESLKVNYVSSKVNWSYQHICPDETMNVLTNAKTHIPTSTMSMLTPLQADSQVKEDPKSFPKFKKISCRNVDNEGFVIFNVTINELGVGESINFEIPIVIVKRYINFEKAFAILYMTTGEVEYIDEKIYAVVSINTTFDVTTEIFPEALTTEKVNIWIIIGGCCGGIIMLVILGFLLWKCGFFKRQKKEDVDKWKRQSGYYASRQSQMIEDKIK